MKSKIFILFITLFFMAETYNAQQITVQISCRAAPVTLKYITIIGGRNAYSWSGGQYNNLITNWYASESCWLLDGYINGKFIQFKSSLNTSPNPPDFSNGNWQKVEGDCTLTALSGSGTFTATSTVTNAHCWNYDDGEITVSPSGGTPPYTYLWSNGKTYPSIEAGAGSYTCTIKDASNNAITLPFTVTQPPALDLTVTQTGNVLKANQNGALSYKWYLNNSPIAGATSQTYTAVQNGEYICQFAYNEAGCDYDTEAITIATLATGENTAARTLSLYPNPATKDVNFNLQENQTVAIYTMDGKLVQSAQAQKGDNKMDVSALPAGTYLLKAKEGTRKFIKK